jgi:3-hydroxyacyl-CoA dehydrogenase
LPSDPRYRIVSRAMFDAGRHGQKTSKGFYAYEGRRALDDEDAIRVIQKLAAEHATPARSDISANEIVERCIVPLINEGLKIVDEGIAYRKSDVDVVWLGGYGFPAELGGPLFYAESIGVDWLRERIDYFRKSSANAYGYWKPAESLAVSKAVRSASSPIGEN